MALLSICNSALYAFCAALQKEQEGSPIRINEVCAEHAVLALTCVAEGAGWLRLHQALLRVIQPRWCPAAWFVYRGPNKAHLNRLAHS